MNDLETFKRLIKENVTEAWKRYVAVAGLFIAWYPVYKIVDVFWHEKSVPWKSVATAIIYAVFGTVFLIYFLYKSLSDAYQKIGPEIPTHKQLTELNGKFFGLQKKVHTINSVLRVDGSSETTQDVTLLALAKQISQIEYSCSAPSVPTGVTGKIEISAQPRQDSGVMITPQVLRQDKNQCFWCLNFVPTLVPNKVIAYRYRQITVPKAFAVDLDELHARGQNEETYAVRVTYPTEELQLKLEFPKSKTPQKISYDVWMGLGRVRHMEEYVRVHTEDSFTSGRAVDDIVCAELNIMYPIQGLRYAIVWTPADAEIVVPLLSDSKT
jgi:hypothetical protein